MVTRSGLETGEAKEKDEIDKLIRKVVNNQEGLDLEKARGTFMEARKDFLVTNIWPSTHLRDVEVVEEVKPFLQACMRLLCSPQAVQNL